MRSGVRQGGVEPLVPQELLDGGDFAASVEELRGTGVAETMGIHGHTGARPAGFDPVVDQVFENGLIAEKEDMIRYVSNNPINATDPSGHREIRDGNNVRYRNIYNSPTPLLTSQSGGKSGSTGVPINPPSAPSVALGGPRITAAPTQTPTYDPFPSIIHNTPTPYVHYSAAPTSTPSAVLREPVGSSLPTTPSIKVTIDWDKVDKVDAVVDGFGLVGDLASLSFEGVGQVVYWGSTALEIGDTVIGGVSLAKGIFEATNEGDPSNLIWDAFEIAVDGGRASRGLGMFFNLLSLGMNIGPHTSISYDR